MSVVLSTLLHSPPVIAGFNIWNSHELIGVVRSHHLLTVKHCCCRKLVSRKSSCPAPAASQLTLNAQQQPDLVLLDDEPMDDAAAEASLGSEWDDEGAGRAASDGEYTLLTVSGGMYASNMT